LPGLTLNLVPAKFATCRGVAFQFEDNDRAEELLRLLAQRDRRTLGREQHRIFQHARSFVQLAFARIMPVVCS
jgi:hypothetical protein